MSKKDLILVIVAEQGYIHSVDTEKDFSYESEQLFTSISDTYIPLLNLFSKLEAQKVAFKLGMVISAPLCSLLADPQVQKQYIDWLDKRIALGDEELEHNKNNPELLQNTKDCLKKLKQDKVDFTETYEQNLLKKFRYFAEKEYLELIPTAATYSYLPYYIDLPEVLNAQIEAGLHAQRDFFGETGEGFYLPCLGWATGLEKQLRSYGINYTILDTRAILFSQSPCDTGIFTPVRTNNSLVLFGRDCCTPEDISGTEGFMRNKVYRSQQRDAGYDLPDESLKTFLCTDSARLQTQLKYWSNENTLYNKTLANEQVIKDAEVFYKDKADKLIKASNELKEKDAILTCTIPAELLGSTWFEGVCWLENIIKLIDEKKQISLALPKEHLQNQFSLQKIEPYPCSAGGAGYSEDLLDNTNNWMMRYVRKASERIIDLTERFPSETGIKARILNLGAKEVLLAQSGSWPKMISSGQHSEYAEKAFKQNIINFSAVFDSLASNTVSTEWLCNLEKADSIFPWINYRIFSKKK